MATADTSEHQAVVVPHGAASPVDDDFLWVYVRRQGGQWHATALDYSIVASGVSPDEAVAKLRPMVDDYLELCARDGISPAEALRPLSMRWSLALLVDVARYAARTLRRGRPRRGGHLLVPRHGC